MKLSKAQQEVVDKMREGWEIYVTHGMFPQAVLEKGSVKRRVFISTFSALQKYGAFGMSKIYPSHTEYRLSEQFKPKQK